MPIGVFAEVVGPEPWFRRPRAERRRRDALHRGALDERRQIGAAAIEPDELRPRLAGALEESRDHLVLTRLHAADGRERDELERHRVVALDPLHRGDRDDPAEDRLEEWARILGRGAGGAVRVREHLGIGELR